MFLDLMYGAGVGLALGMTGGGGVLAVPALVLGLGYTLPQAKPVALIAVGGSAFLGCIDGFRRGLVRYKAAAVMAILGILCAPIGLWLGRVLSTTTLMLVFCLLLIAISAKMFLQATSSCSPNKAAMVSQLNCRLNPETGRFKWTGRCFASFSAIGGFSGLLSGMLGLGGGFIIVPGVRHLSDLNMHGTVATALAVISFISAGTVTSFLLAGGIIEPQAWRFIAAASVGMLIGRRLAPLVAGNVLQIGFSLLVCIAAVMLFVRAVLAW